MYFRNTIMMNQRAGRVDRLADWLLTHCPCSSLTLLTVLVVGSAHLIPRPLPVVAGIISADVAINLVRKARRDRRAARAIA